MRDAVQHKNSMSIQSFIRSDGKLQVVKMLLTPEERQAHVSWTAMRTRCNRTPEKFPDYDSYGGKNIKVCTEWIQDFAAFYRDMGPPPSPLHTLDRRNRNEGYSKENCRWATDKEQAINRDTTVFLTINGRTETASDWERISGIKAATILKRVRTGRPENEWLYPEELEKRSKRMITLRGQTKTLAAWARELNMTAPGLQYRLRTGADPFCPIGKRNAKKKISVDDAQVVAHTDPH